MEPNKPQSNLQYTWHAQIRKEQREITDELIDNAMGGGKQVNCIDSTVYRDQDVTVVVSKEGSVITVNKNKRNKLFLISERTKEKKESLLLKVKNENNDHAMCELAELYLSGELGEKDAMKAHDLFEKAAEKGSSHAMCRLSGLYELGELGDPNQEVADMWLEKAANKNNTYALAIMGQKLLAKYVKKYPPGSKIHTSEALKEKSEVLRYLNKSARKGSTRPMWQLGNIYEKGLLGEKDLSKATELYVKAAKIGSPSSLHSLHTMTLNCTFSCEDLEEILDGVSSYLTTTSIGMALQLGQEQIMGELGHNPVRGLNMIEQAALKQYDRAMVQLITCYRDGTACQVNLRLAQYWYRKLHDLYDASAKEGNLVSLWKLGTLYLKGYVGDIDLTKAESCFAKAAEESCDPQRVFDLGLLYLEGRLGNKPTDIGVELIAKAIRKWRLQADQGITTAYLHLAKAYLSINSHKDAVYWLSKAPVSDIHSQACLAEIYLDNESPEKNIVLGLKILECLILEHGISPQTALKYVGFSYNPETLLWLQTIADNVKMPKTSEMSNEQKLHKFSIIMLALEYEFGRVGEIDYNLASKYYHQLFVKFESVRGGNKLVMLCSKQCLPKEYVDTAKSWVLKIPAVLESDKVDYSEFRDCVLLLSKVYQENILLERNIKEASKWLYLASYFNSSKDKPGIESDLANLPQLNCEEKEQIMSELTKTTQNIKSTSLTNYKVMSRILGDIYSDNKIVKQDIPLAVHWYTESAARNNSLASLRLGNIYQERKSMYTSIRWYKLSVKQGNSAALKALTDICENNGHQHLSSFLSKYKHQPSVDESQLVDINPLKNLESYPRTRKEMYELAKRCLSPEIEQFSEAAFWFREAMERGHIGAALELHSMYRSGILGSHLIHVCKKLSLNILNMCYSKLKYVTLLEEEEYPSSTLSLLKDTHSILQVQEGNHKILDRLTQNINEILNKTQTVDSETINDLVKDLGLLKLELVTNDLGQAIINALERLNLSGDASNSDTQSNQTSTTNS